MQSFNKITRSDIPIIYEYLLKEQSLACDFSIGGCFIWADFFQTRYAIIDDTLVFSIVEENEPYYTYPIGKNEDAAFAFIENDAKSRGISLKFFIFSERHLEYIKKRYPDCVSEEKREHFDYMYDYDSLCTFKGKKLSGQRNHVNKFKRLYDEYSFEEITKENCGEVAEFFRTFIERTEKKNDAIKAEAIKIFDLLENMKDCHQFGGFLRIGNEIVGFSIAERLGQTMFVHVEKADTRYEGVYQMLVCSFASHFAKEGILYINREDDVGDEGLRRSKLSYHPLFLVKKYTVSV